MSTEKSFKPLMTYDPTRISDPATQPFQSAAEAMLRDHTGTREGITSNSKRITLILLAAPVLGVCLGLVASVPALLCWLTIVSFFAGITLSFKSASYERRKDGRAARIMQMADAGYAVSFVAFLLTGYLTGGASPALLILGTFLFASGLGHVGATFSRRGTD